MDANVFYGRSFDDFLLIPQYSVVQSRKDVDTKSFLTRARILDFPVVSSNMDTVTEASMAIEIARAGGFGFIHRAMPITEQVRMVRQVHDAGFPVGAAIGARGDYLQRTEELIAAGVNVFLVDIACAHSRVMERAIEYLRYEFGNQHLIAGNIATSEGAKFLLDLGVDAIKVGLGSGSACRTRLETGFGVGQLEAIRSVWLAVGGLVPIIADGGIRNDKDIFMALAAGASSVMLGGMLSGTDEAPGNLITEQSGEKYKIFRGMASTEAQFERGEYKNSPEGQTMRVAYKGPAKLVLDRIRGHLQSSISYSGFASLADVHQEMTPNFVQYLTVISPATVKESYVR